MVRTRTLATMIGTLVAALMTSRIARAEGAHARLRYELEDPRGVCADEATFRARVASRLGYDAFRDDASLELRVRIVARGATVTAEITSVAPGRPAGKRTLEDPRCDALGDAVASAAALVLDPVAAPPPEPEPAPLPAPPVSGAIPPPAALPERPSPNAASASPETTTDPLLLADFTVAFARTPAALLGVRVGLGLRRGVHSLTVEGRAETSPADASIGDRDRVEASAFSAALVPCRHFDIVALCGVALAGVREVKALDVVNPAAQRSAMLVLGARLGLELPLGSGAPLHLALRANAEAGASLLRDTYTTDGIARTTTSPVEATLGAGLLGRFQ
ncbi:MAG: hypothetical protein JWP97_4333 [Labilithrix sp.]|nr:hypothetical protein [Labilithrix sp.]